MNSNGRHTGIPSEGELLAGPGIPDRERIEKGPVAFIECVQDIPCNPCEEACPFGAITVGEPITNLPVLTESLHWLRPAHRAIPGLKPSSRSSSLHGKHISGGVPYSTARCPARGSCACGDRNGEDDGRRS